MVMGPQISNQGAAPVEQEPSVDMSVNDDGSQPVGNPQTGGIEQQLDALPDQDKAFLAQYLTPEFVYAMGLVNPDAAQYLSQFVDKSKILVPLNREKAVQLKQQLDQQNSKPQGQPAPQQAVPSMTPVQAPMPRQQTLPNGVAPAPMQGGVMAPR